MKLWSENINKYEIENIDWLRIRSQKEVSVNM